MFPSIPKFLSLYTLLLPNFSSYLDDFFLLTLAIQATFLQMKCFDFFDLLLNKKNEYKPIHNIKSNQQIY